MTGGEIVAVGKAAQAVGTKALGEDEKTKDVLLRIAEDTPEMRAAARSMAARTAVKERVKLKLYEPFALMLGVSKTYFEDKFPQEMGAKIADIPDENLVTPPANVAVPALQGLSYSFEEPNLKELYLNLLATASDDRKAIEAHPAFAEVIKQLTPSETKLLNTTLRHRTVAAVRVKNELADPPRSFVILRSHLIPLVDATQQPIIEPQAPAWIDNWQRPGLVDVTYTEFAPQAGMYDWVETRPEYVELAKLPDITKLNFDKGLIRNTDFGQQFFRAVT